jgi:shikimate dehydrogenase
VVRALAHAGAADIAVLNRNAGRAQLAAALGGSPGGAPGGPPGGAPLGGVGRVGTAADVGSSDLVVNATPVGMDGTPAAGRLPVDATLLRPGQVVVDLVYHPVRTPLLEAAARRGAVAIDGVGMLVHQAGHAFRTWTGLDPPLAAMDAAARRAIAAD